ncbi:MAG: relaxase domain-containing protein [Actinomycetota bacterium]|nr:relaxase domain-containing protein [Actinomycetota bacterium]
MGKVSAGQEGYYLTAVAHGAEDYYSEYGEVPGRWIGSGAGELGLAGEVDDDEFRTVLSGADPSTGDRLRRGNAHVCAFDLTLSAPKSVSLLWALGDTDTAAAVIEAHEHAVDAAVGYVEREALRSRRGHDGLEQLDGGGLIGAAFRHRTSRSGDPQLHTHVVVANATRCEDGVWRTLDGRHLYAHARTAGFLYQAELRHALSCSLGVEWEPVVKGTAEVTGIPHEALRGFSRRRIQIEEAMTEEGETSIRSARRLAVQTRDRKQYDVDPATLAIDWHARAGLHGLDPAALRGLLSPQRASKHPSVPTRVQRSAQVTDEALARMLTEQDATFDRRAALRVLAEQAPAGARVSDLEAQADLFLASRYVEAVGVALTGVQYSTVELLAIETQLLDNAVARRDEGVGVCDASAVEGAQSLSDQQAAMVTKLTTDGAGISVVIGAAGTGKTYALGVAREAWEQDGHIVIGCALSARAAQELQTGSGIQSSTLHLLLAALERPQSPGLSSGTVVVVDEAAMVGTVQLARLCEHAARDRAKVVLVGDHHQLPAIEAGGAFAALGARLGAAHLTDNQRQTDAVEREALGELRSGDLGRALELLDSIGHVEYWEYRDTVNRRIVGDWLPAVLDGDDAIMLASTRADVGELNKMARYGLIANGHVAPTGLDIDGQTFAVGDRVMTLKNDRRLRLINGERGAIAAITDRDIVVSFDDRHEPTRIPTGYLEDGGLDHAYAMTIHKAQGLTCDRAFVLGDELLHREAAYTALSRGRHENRLYTVLPGKYEPHIPEPISREPDLTRTLEQSISKTLATHWQQHPRGHSAERDHDVGMEL